MPATPQNASSAGSSTNRIHPWLRRCANYADDTAAIPSQREPTLGALVSCVLSGLWQAATVSRWVTFMVFSLTVFVGASCAAPRGCPKHGGDAWREVNTPHFSVKTNLGKQDAHSHARTLESSYRLLQFWISRWLPVNRSEHDPIDVIHFATPDGLHDYARRTNGFVSNRAGAILMVTAKKWRRSETLQLLQHELTHRFMSDYLGILPTWVAEGVAEFFSTVTLQNGKSVAGKLNWRASLYWFNDNFETASIKKLRQSSNQTFHSNKRGSSNYFAAWRAVHYFATSSAKLQRGFSNYVHLLSERVPEQEAWEQSFGASEETHDRQVRIHQGMRRVPLLVLARPSLPKTTVSSRVLSEGETHRLFAKMWLHTPYSPGTTSAGRMAKIAQEVNLAIEHEPDFHDIPHLEFTMLGPKLARPGAVERLRSYANDHPGDAKVLRTVLGHEMLQASDGDKRQEELAKLLPLAKSLARVASTYSEFNEAAWYFSQVNMPKEGLPLAQVAINREPLCHHCLDTFALLLHQDGQTVLASIIQERAVALYKQRGSVPADVSGRLKQFQEAASALQSSGGSAGSTN